MCFIIFKDLAQRSDDKNKGVNKITFTQVSFKKIKI